MIVYIFNGTHFSLPPQVIFFVLSVIGNATFSDLSKYDLKNNHQIDWNKLTGISFTPLQPDINAIMVVWRYNLKTELFEIGPYFNDKSARIMPSKNETISVPVNEPFYFNIDYNGISVKYNNKSVYKETPQDLQKSFFTSIRIDGWFGGNSVAPNDISYEINFN